VMESGVVRADESVSRAKSRNALTEAVGVVQLHAEFSGKV